MKIAVAQINTANGDLHGNDRKIRKMLYQARSLSPALILFPELCLVGYPPKDFLFQSGFLNQARSLVDALARDYQDLHFMIGSVEKNANVVYDITQGKVRTVFQKNLLPNYDVFDERRYFKPGQNVAYIECEKKKIGVTICEDLWFKDSDRYEHDPIEQFQNAKIDLLINISASPFETGKHEHRKKIVAQHAKKLSVPVVYVNLVGGNDELIFDGGSFVMDSQANIRHQLPFFAEDLTCVDPFQSGPVSVESIDETDKLAGAITTGLRDYIYKCGFKDVTLGLSGGIDSALVLLLAIEAFGKNHVHPVFMPSKFTSSMSKEDVRAIVDQLKIGLTMIPIDEVTQVYTQVLESSLDHDLQKLTVENIQARIRGMLLMACSAEKKSLVIGTGNKSEIATGYATLYGDLIGAVLPLGDLYKHQVYAIARRLNEKYKAIPDRVFDRPPSAELSENQKDSDQLPEYDILDPLVKAYVEGQSSEKDMIEQGFSKKILDQAVPLLVNSEFKRRQAPPILRVSSKAFGVGRRMPIARKSYDV